MDAGQDDLEDAIELLRNYRAQIVETKARASERQQSETARIDRAIAAITTASKASARAASWADVMRRIGHSVNCLYSTFPDGNEHIVRAVATLAAGKRAAPKR